MKFLIQHNLMAEEQLLRIKEAVKDYPHEFIGLIPFSHEFTSDVPLIGLDYIPYGSTLMTTLACDKGWKGLHFNTTTFSIRASLENRNDMLNRGFVIPVADAERFLRHKDEDVFVRPNLDLKQFSGQVMNSIECADWLKDAMSLPEDSGSYAMRPDVEILISTPKNIQAEWRYFIVGGRVVSGSMYRYRGQMKQEMVEQDSDVYREAQKYADKWLPDSCCVMDLALSDDHLYVIEFNTINSSGLYKNDAKEIFSALWEFHQK